MSICARQPDGRWPSLTLTETVQIPREEAVLKLHGQWKARLAALDAGQKGHEAIMAALVQDAHVTSKPQAYRNALRDAVGTQYEIWQQDRKMLGRCIGELEEALGIRPFNDSPAKPEAREGESAELAEIDRWCDSVIKKDGHASP